MARGQTGVSQRVHVGFLRSCPPDIPPPHHRDDTPRERGRPARMLSLYLPLSFPAMRHPATLPGGTARARPKQSHGAVAGRPGWRRWARLCQDLCGRDARAPGWASSHDIVTPRERNRRSICVPLVVEAGPCVLLSICVHSCPFVVHLHLRRSRRAEPKAMERDRRLY